MRSRTSCGFAGTGSDFADFLLGVPDTSAIAFGNADKYFRESVYDFEYHSFVYAKCHPSVIGLFKSQSDVRKVTPITR